MDVLVGLREFGEKLSKYLLCCGKSCKCSDAKGLVWDIYLSTDDQIKQKAREFNKGELSDETLRRIVSCAMPKYLWVVSFMDGGERYGTFFVDATGIAQDINVFLGIYENEELRIILREVSDRPSLKLNPFARCIRNSAA